ncbi:MAG: alpha/beta hydrolase [Candidatus Binataceae bacterium]
MKSSDQIISSDDEPPSQMASGQNAPGQLSSAQISGCADKRDFFFPGDGLSALLIHGLTGTPYEMRWLGERMTAAGIRVRGVRLAGHAGAPEELGAANYDNWYESVVQGFEDLRQYGDPNIVVGLSAGAVLAARLAMDQREAVAGISMLAPAFYLPRSTTLLLRMVQRLGRISRQLYLYSPGDSDIHDAAARRIHPTTHLFPISGPINLLDLSKIVRRRLQRITQPALLIHSRLDHTCPMERNVNFVMKHLGSAEKRCVILEESYHVITVDSEKEQVAAEVLAFAEQFRAPRSRAASG